MRANPVIRSFNAGELSPLLDGRSDLAKYASGCRVLKNMLPTPYGAAVRRPGTLFISKTDWNDQAVRLVPFMYSVDDVYILVFGDGYMRIAKAGADPTMVGWSLVDIPEWQATESYIKGQVVKHGLSAYVCAVEESTTGTWVPSEWQLLPSEEVLDDPTTGDTWVRWLYQIESPYSESELAQLQWAQINDVMWIVHPNHPPQTVKRYAESRWRIDPVETQGGPFAPENDDDDLYLACTAKTGSGTLQALRKEQVAVVTGANYTTADKKVSASAGAFATVTVGSFVYLDTEDAGLVSDAYQVTDKATDDSWIECSDAVSSGDASNVSVFRFVADQEVFTESMVGSLMRLSYIRTHQWGHTYVSATGWTESTAHALPALRVIDGYEVITHGDWQGTLAVQERIGLNGEWETVRTLSSNLSSGTGDKNYLISQDVNEPNLYARVFSPGGITAGNNTFGVKLSSIGNRVDGVVKITGFTSASEVSVDILEDLAYIKPTTLWAEGAWNGRRGYPSAIEISAGRLVFGGTAAEPQTIWRSAVDDYTNFWAGTRDDDADTYTIASGTQNGIRWIKAFGSALMIGTRGAEHILRPAEGEVLSATNLDQQQQSSYGSASVQAAMLHDAVFFVERDGDGIRALKYRFETDSYAAQDATILAEHIAKAGIRTIAVQTQPMGILWCVLNDGTLATFTYEPFHDVQAWSRHETQGTVLDVAVVPTAGEDQLWMAVERVHDYGDNTRIFIECMKPIDAGRQLAMNDTWFLDAALSYSGSEASRLYLCDHMHRSDIDVLADGKVYHNLEVDAYGSITLPEPASHVVAGLGYESALRPTRPEFTGQGNSTLGSVQRVYETAISVWRTQRMSVGTAKDQYREVILGSDETALWSGVHVEPVGDAFDRTGEFYIVQQNPLPLTVRSLMLRLEFSDE